MINIIRSWFCSHQWKPLAINPVHQQGYSRPIKIRYAYVCLKCASIRKHDV